MDYKKINDYEVVYLVKENDEEARKIIFNKYIPIVRKLASKYSMSAKWARVDFDDLVQEGLIALNDAIDKYDENSGALFYTFACICVERRILTFCRNKEISRLLDKPITTVDGRLYKIRKVLHERFKNVY